MKKKKSNISSGNFLAFIAACRWLQSLKYIYPDGYGDDIAWMHFKDFDEESCFMQLKKLSEKQINNMLLGDMYNRAKQTIPLEYEPEIPFSKISKSAFLSSLNYDYIFITKSPAFTPVTSDNLLPLFNKYIELV